jgi:hypothetical protein
MLNLFAVEKIVKLLLLSCSLLLLTLFKCFLASLLSMPAKSVAKNDPTPVTRSMLKTGTQAVTKSSKRSIFGFEGSNYVMLLILKLIIKFV